MYILLLHYRCTDIEDTNHAISTCCMLLLHYRCTYCYYITDVQITITLQMYILLLHYRCTDIEDTNDAISTRERCPITDDKHRKTDSAQTAKSDVRNAADVIGTHRVATERLNELHHTCDVPTSKYSSNFQRQTHCKSSSQPSATISRDALSHHQPTGHVAQTCMTSSSRVNKEAASSMNIGASAVYQKTPRPVAYGRHHDTKDTYYIDQLSPSVVGMTTLGSLGHPFSITRLMMRSGNS